jgi:hypothetical protein
VCSCGISINGDAINGDAFILSPKIGLVHSQLPNPCYLGMKAPEQGCRKSVEEGTPEAEQAFISERVQRNALTENLSFVDEVEERIGFRLEHRRPGRPALIAPGK